MVGRVRRRLSVCILLVFCIGTTAFANMIYSFEIFNNSKYENDPQLNFTLTVTNEGLNGSGQQLVGFRFDNDSTATSSITDIYFDACPDSGLLNAKNVTIINSSGVSFSKNANPKSLPGGNELEPKFDKKPEYSADSDSPVSHNGINPGEWLKLIFTLESDKSYDDIIFDIANGGSTTLENLRVGIHIQSLPGCDDSASAINCTKSIPEPATICLLGIGVLSLLNKKYHTQKKRRQVMKTNTQFVTIILLAIICLAITANAAVIQPSPADAYDLDHANYYIWQVNLSLAEEQILTSVSIHFNNINDWQIESGDKLYISLMNENELNNAVQDKNMTKASGSDLYKGTDNQAVGNALDGYGQVLAVYEDNNEYWSYWNHQWINPAEDFTYNFSASEINLLNSYISNGGVFGIGLDPDCRYYNDGITLCYETDTIPEPATIAMLSIGSLILIRRKK